jgi:hypothetical protein
MHQEDSMIRKFSQCLFGILATLTLFFQSDNNSVFALSKLQEINPPLKELVVTADEMKKHADLSASFDVTDEISDICPYDCVKIIWGTTSDKLTLMMMQFNTPEQAQNASQNLHSIFQTFGNKYIVFSENNSQWSGQLYSSRNKFQWATADAQGPILIFSSYRKVLNGFVADIDGYYYRNMVESLTSIQKQKLQDAGYK